MAEISHSRNVDHLPTFYSPLASPFKPQSLNPKSKQKHHRTSTIPFPYSPYSLLNPSEEFSKTHYSKANFEKALMRNALTPTTSQIENRRSSNPENKNRQISKTEQTKRPPTEAFNKWKNDEKCKLLMVEDDIFENQAKNFKRFDDEMATHTSWMKSFDQEKTLKDILFKQLEYNGKNKELISFTLGNFQQNSVSQVVEKLTDLQKKLNRMPPVKKTKKKPLKYLNLNDQYATYVAAEPFEEETLTSYTFFCSILSQISWKPSVREGATLMAHEGKVYLYGGLSNELHSDLCELTIEDEMCWKKIKTTGDLPSGGRTGHSVFPWKNGMMVFGGEKRYNKEMKIRECFNDLRYLNLNSFEWKWVRPFGDIIEARRNNAYCAAGKWLFIHGGINNYEHMKWHQCDVINETELDGIGFHTMCGIFKGEPKLSSIYHPFDYFDKKKEKVSVVGLYIFGGKLKNSQSLNSLTVLKFGTKPLKWIPLETKGEKPNPRYNHSMNHYPDLNILIIYGGKSDVSLKPKKGTPGEIFSDVWVLSLSNLAWIKVRANRVQEMDRCSHATTIFESSLLVFGGYNKNNYANSNLYCMELNQKKAKNLFQENKQKTLYLHKNDPEHRESITNDQAQTQLESDELAMDGNLVNEIKNRNNKLFKYNQLAFSNFRSFMPLPRKLELIEKK